MNPINPEAATPATYDLAFRVDSGRFIMRYQYAGVRLNADGMEWTAGTPHAGRYADIISIHISQGHVARSGAIGSCRIVFNTGDMIIITSSTDWGYASDEGNRIFADFLTDLHARLSEADVARIAFIGGNTGGMHKFGQAAMVVAGLFFVVLPLGLLVYTGDLQALFIAVGGGFLVYPLWRVTQKNEPRRYDPRRLDPDLFP